MAQVTVVDHPLVRCHLTSLRDSATPSAEFRLLVRRLAVLLTYEATATLAVEPRRVTTPLEAAEGCQLSQRIALVPILRAGLGMVDPILELIPTAEVWHLGLYRDETTAKP
ncbi:MAG: uracil phosphoribosyltransferase, partial [Planctomycetaceae bacterium]|nr:uracil phosphoribosyltransferase [Planctomycetaceae bacterium]